MIRINNNLRKSKSKELYKKAEKVLPAGVTYAIRHFEPYPIYIAYGSGSRVYDVDGNQYVDYWLGHGALLLGHCHPPVMEAVKKQIEFGSHFGYCHEWEIKLAEQIVKMVPSAQMVRFTNSGTEANMYTIRLARAYTGRSKIGKFEGCWHGGYDALHKAVNWPFNIPESAGLHQKAMADTVILPFNDLNGVERIVKKSMFACIIIEPVLGVGGFIPAEKEFLKGLREICDKTGTLLIFDEVITGFRLAPGGAQEFFDVHPDLTVLGKIVGGGGFPAGAFCGKSDIMELTSHIKYPNRAERSFHGGTYCGNPVTMRSGYVTLKELEKHHVYTHIDKLGEKARDELQKAFGYKNIKAYVTGIGSLFCVHFTKKKPYDARSADVEKNIKLSTKYHTYLLSKGIILMKPDRTHFFTSFKHDDEDIENLISMTRYFIRNL